MAASRPPPPKSLYVDLTIVSAKHLKNVNWKNGDLKPYAVFWIDPDRRLATKSDDSGATKPVWNEQFTLPLTLALADSFLTLEIFHSKPSETPKPLVGTLRVPLKDLVESDDSNQIRVFQLTRPSGRPQGKIRVKLAIRERPLPPDYHIPSPPSYYYSSAPPPPPARDHRGYSSPLYTPSLSSPPLPSPSQYGYSSYPEAYPGYYSGYYSAPPPPLPPRPFFDRTSSYGVPTGPSAPIDQPYDQKMRSGKIGLGAGLAVGAVGGLALEEGLKYEEDKIAERVEHDLNLRDNYSDYRGDY